MQRCPYNDGNIYCNVVRKRIFETPNGKQYCNRGWYYCELYARQHANDYVGQCANCGTGVTVQNVYMNPSLPVGQYCPRCARMANNY